MCMFFALNVTNNVANATIIFGLINPDFCVLSCLGKEQSGIFIQIEDIEFCCLEEV